jgi:hypothetical protein
VDDTSGPTSAITFVRRAPADGESPDATPTSTPGQGGSKTPSPTSHSTPKPGSTPTPSPTATPTASPTATDTPTPAPTAPETPTISCTPSSNVDGTYNVSCSILTGTPQDGDTLQWYEDGGIAVGAVGPTLAWDNITTDSGSHNVYLVITRAGLSAQSATVGGTDASDWLLV